MGIDRPFYRTVRQFVDGEYSEGGRSRYVAHPAFADRAESYVRSFAMLQADFRDLLEYIEPADQNRESYSLRTYELLLRACTEVETNCKAILRSNAYPEAKWTMSDYCKIELSHYLSQYRVKVPYWHGAAGDRAPFASWANGGRLAWYQAYNDVKHDRAQNLHRATLEHLVDGVCAAAVLLSAQFFNEEFSPAPDHLVFSGDRHNDGYETAIGEFFRVRYPDAVPVAERYDFDWQAIRDEDDPFHRFDYSHQR